MENGFRHGAERNARASAHPFPKLAIRHERKKFFLLERGVRAGHEPQQIKKAGARYVRAEKIDQIEKECLPVAAGPLRFAGILVALIPSEKRGGARPMAELCIDRENKAIDKTLESEQGSCGFLCSAVHA